MSTPPTYKKKLIEVAIPLEAINAALNPINNQIKKWINDNIVY